MDLREREALELQIVKALFLGEGELTGVAESLERLEEAVRQQRASESAEIARVEKLMRNVRECSEVDMDPFAKGVWLIALEGYKDYMVWGIQGADGLSTAFRSPYHLVTHAIHRAVLDENLLGRLDVKLVEAPRMDDKSVAQLGTLLVRPQVFLQNLTWLHKTNPKMAQAVTDAVFTRWRRYIRGFGSDREDALAAADEVLGDWEIVSDTLLGTWGQGHEQNAVPFGPILQNLQDEHLIEGGRSFYPITSLMYLGSTLFPTLEERTRAMEVLTIMYGLMAYHDIFRPAAMDSEQEWGTFIGPLWAELGIYHSRELHEKQVQSGEWHVYSFVLSLWEYFYDLSKKQRQSDEIAIDMTQPLVGFGAGWVANSVQWLAERAVEDARRVGLVVALPGGKLVVMSAPRDTLGISKFKERAMVAGNVNIEPEYNFSATEYARLGQLVKAIQGEWGFGQAVDLVADAVGQAYVIGHLQRQKIAALIHGQMREGTGRLADHELISILEWCMSDASQEMVAKQVENLEARMVGAIEQTDRFWKRVNWIPQADSVGCELGIEKVEFRPDLIGHVTVKIFFGGYHYTCQFNKFGKITGLESLHPFLRDRFMVVLTDAFVKSVDAQIVKDSLGLAELEGQAKNSRPYVLRVLLGMESRKKEVPESVDLFRQVTGMEGHAPGLELVELDAWFRQVVVEQIALDEVHPGYRKLVAGLLGRACVQLNLVTESEAKALARGNEWDRLPELVRLINEKVVADLDSKCGVTWWPKSNN